MFFSCAFINIIDRYLRFSLIFASGTLAPLATYAGELRIPFDFQMGSSFFSASEQKNRIVFFNLECNHVIDVHRTFITTLSHGRNSNIKLRATYQHVDKPEFQVIKYLSNSQSLIIEQKKNFI